MNGDQFYKVLEDLGYKDTESDGKIYDYMFEDTKILPFLEWFSDCLHEENVLTSKEYDDFLKLQQKGNVLDGDQLQIALQNLTLADESDLSNDSLREEIEQMEVELNNRKLRKDVLAKQRNILSSHQSYLTDKVKNIDAAANQAKRTYKNYSEESFSVNMKINQKLLELTEKISELTALYQEGNKTLETPINSTFISQINPNKYYIEEEKYAQELHCYTKKQFFEGIADMTGETSVDRYNFLEVSNPISLLVRGEKEDVNIDDCKGLARLQAIYPKSESERLNALIMEGCSQAVYKFAQDKLQSLQLKPYPCDVGELRNKLQETTATLAVLKTDLDQLSENDIPALITENADLRVTKILRGNYDLKIARQDYFIANQNKLMKQLIAQRSRNEFLNVAYAIEAREHHDTHRLLTSAIMLLQKNLQQFKDRMTMIDDLTATQSKHQRSTIDSRDSSTLQLYKLLDTEEESVNRKQLYFTYNNLKGNADGLQKRYKAVTASLTSMERGQDDRLAMLESTLKSCEAVLYADSSTNTGMPLLSAKPIVDTMSQLDRLLQKLEHVVMDITKSIESKKKILQTNPQQAAEREIFIYFFTDPEKLRQVMKRLSNRIVT